MLAVAMRGLWHLLPQQGFPRADGDSVSSIVQGRYYCYAHSTGKGTEAERGQLTR